MEIIAKGPIFELTEKKIRPEETFAQKHHGSGLSNETSGSANVCHLVSTRRGDYGLVHLTRLGEGIPIYMMEPDAFVRGGDEHVSLIPVKGEDMV